MSLVIIALYGCLLANHRRYDISCPLEHISISPSLQNFIFLLLLLPFLRRLRPYPEAPDFSGGSGYNRRLRTPAVTSISGFYSSPRVKSLFHSSAPYPFVPILSRTNLLSPSPLQTQETLVSFSLKSQGFGRLISGGSGDLEGAQHLVGFHPRESARIGLKFISFLREGKNRIFARSLSSMP